MWWLFILFLIVLISQKAVEGFGRGGGGRGGGRVGGVGGIGRVGGVGGVGRGFGRNVNVYGGGYGGEVSVNVNQPEEEYPLLGWLKHKIILP